MYLPTFLGTYLQDAPMTVGQEEIENTETECVDYMKTIDKSDALWALLINLMTRRLLLKSTKKLKI